MGGSTGRSHWGKHDEELYNWASWLFSSRTVPLLPSSSPLPQVAPPPPHFSSHLLSSHLPHLSLAGLLSEGAEGHSTCAASEECRNERWHITTTFRSLISAGCHSALISWMKNAIHYTLLRNIAFCVCLFLGCNTVNISTVALLSYYITMRAPSHGT